MVCNVYASIRQSQPGLYTVAMFRSVSELTGVSERAVGCIKAESQRGPLQSPKRRINKLSPRNDVKKTGKTRIQRYDTFSLGALRRKVHSYFLRNEVPTALKIRNNVTNDPDFKMPSVSIRTLQRFLNDIGFAFRKRKQNSALLERDDIIVWRRKYLRTIREMRKQ